MNNPEIKQAEIDKVYDVLNREAEYSGYHLNPDVALTRELIKGLIVNEKRYGYRACPCRLASGKKSDDLDIICPCDYRDHDLLEYEACYCSLYVSEAATLCKVKIGSIPERRPSTPEKRKKKTAASSATSGRLKLPLPVWRCKVCGYLCARDAPPEVCPICKAKKERFERFI